MGVYSVCIPTGDSWLNDTLNGFIMTMDENVDVFAQKVQEDPYLAKGFNCIGLSQGNNICRGYIQRYNDPVAFAHLSIHGPVVGEHNQFTPFIRYSIAMSHNCSLLIILRTVKVLLHSLPVTLMVELAPSVEQ